MGNTDNTKISYKSDTDNAKISYKIFYKNVWEEQLGKAERDAEIRGFKKAIETLKNAKGADKPTYTSLEQIAQWLEEKIRVEG